jgi:MFS family permease
MSDQPIVYGLLLGCFGIGAVLGAVAMQPARARWSLETVASAAVIVLGATMIACGFIERIYVMAVALLIAGSGWLVFISLVSALVQGLAPDWARARVLSVFILTFQGGLAAGSAVWGVVATKAGTPTAFMVAGLTTIATVIMAAFMKLPDATGDTTPWNHWRMPAIIQDVAQTLEHRPALVSVRYRVRAKHEEMFLEAMEEYGRIRRRDGASWWGIFRDLERANVYLEAFLVTSWAEHLRQHERFTQADREVEDEIRVHVEDEPDVQHFVQAERD